MGYDLRRATRVMEAFLDGDEERAVELHKEMPECDLNGCDRKASHNYGDLGDYCSGYHQHLDR